MLSLFLFIGDLYSDYFQVWRSKITAVIVPVQNLVNSPFRAIKYLGVMAANKNQLIKDNEHLQHDLLIATTQTQRLNFLEYENLRLRELVNDHQKVSHAKMLLAEVLSSLADNFGNRLTIDRGKKDGVGVGQAVLGQGGIVGQVITVDLQVSKVLPITNKKSAVPVLITRNGLRAIAVGMGNKDFLELIGMQETADVKEGDMLVSSGLGGVFPAGYSLGVINKIKRSRGERFLKIIVSPKVKFDSVNYLLVFVSDRRSNR